MNSKYILFLVGLCLLCGLHLSAHQPGNSSLSLRLLDGGVLEGEYHVADVDFESINLMLEDQFRYAMTSSGTREFDANADGVRALAFLELLQAGQPVMFATALPQRVETDGNLHTMIPFKAILPSEDPLEIRLRNFFRFDPQHRVVINLDQDGDQKVGLMTQDNPSWTVSLEEPGALHQFVVFTWEGVFHIWIGIDHILFLIALLLPSVLRFQDNKWIPVSNFHDAFINVLKIVTAFTIAHSITLSLAALHILSLPSRFVESVIAVSVVLAALNNLYPLVSKRAWMVAFGFGLIHGFGFANVLADLALSTNTLAIALLSFNVGVEMGQLAIVAVVFPVIFFLRDHRIYQPLKLRAGSTVIAAIALGWMVDRIFGLEMMPF